VPVPGTAHLDCRLNRSRKWVSQRQLHGMVRAAGYAMDYVTCEGLQGGSGGIRRTKCDLPHTGR